MNRKRADAIRELVGTLCPTAARYRLTEHTSLERALELATNAGTSPKRTRDVSPEIEQEVIRDFQERHYREWLDTPLPALRGRTPRHAATLKTLRPAVIELLKDFERHAERERQSGSSAYDFS